MSKSLPGLGDSHGLVSRLSPTRQFESLFVFTMKSLTEAISSVWHYQHHGGLLINLHHTETQLGQLSKKCRHDQKTVLTDKKMKSPKPQVDKTSEKNQSITQPALFFLCLSGFKI